MIAISPIRTRRLQADLSELSIGDVMTLLALPEDKPEYTTTEFLRRAVKSEAREGIATDPRLWTVQERYFAVAHYIAHITDGDPDFPIGSDAHFSDYILEGQDHATAPVSLGLVAEDNWAMQPLLGVHAESIERLIVSGILPPGRTGWWFGAMAVQLYRPEKELPFDVGEKPDAELDEFITSRVEILKAMPERAFLALLIAFLDGKTRLDHILRLEFLDDGIAFMPVKEVPGSAPARFPVSRAFTELSVQAFK